MDVYLCVIMSHTQYVITSLSVCYYITVSMLLQHSQYVITSHSVCYYITVSMLLHHIHYLISYIHRKQHKHDDAGHFNPNYY